MTQRHRTARLNQEISHEQRWQKEEQRRAARLRNGYKGLWDRLTGSHKRTRLKNEKEA